MRFEQIGDATLYHGDSLEILSTLSDIDIHVSDPPYAFPMQSVRGKQLPRVDLMNTAL